MRIGKTRTGEARWGQVMKNFEARYGIYHKEQWKSSEAFRRGMI